MIITVTLNPALDKTCTVEELRPGELNRLRNVTIDPGGKGINVSRAIQALGGESTATGFLGGGAGAEIETALKMEGIRQSFVHISETTRTNTKVIDRSGTLTELNEPGPYISAEDMGRLDSIIFSHAKSGTLFVFSGSIPGGVEPAVYAKWITFVRSRGAKTILDGDGEAFRLAIAAKPDYIKPNRYELMQYFNDDCSEPTEEHLVLRCKQLLESGVGHIVLSMGRQGAIFVGGGRVLRASALDVPAHSTVGAGDSMVAAFAYAENAGSELGFHDAAALSMAAAAAAVSTPGTKPPPRDAIYALLPQVRLYDLD